MTRDSYEMRYLMLVKKGYLIGHKLFDYYQIKMVNSKYIISLIQCLF